MENPLTNWRHSDGCHSLCRIPATAKGGDGLLIAKPHRNQPQFCYSLHRPLQPVDAGFMDFVQIHFKK